jgi:hypothetical protein
MQQAKTLFSPVNDACARRRRDAGPHRHRALAPMGGVRRLLVERQVHDLLDSPRRQRLAPGRAGRVLQQLVHPLGRVASPPATHGENAFTHSRCHLDRANPSPANSTIRDRPTTFCGVLRSLTSLASRSRSSGGTWMRSILPIRAGSHP